MSIVSDAAVVGIFPGKFRSICRILRSDTRYVDPSCRYQPRFRAWKACPVSLSLAVSTGRVECQSIMAHSCRLLLCDEFGETR